MAASLCESGPNGGPCGNYRQGAAYDLTQCRLCWLVAHNLDYRRAYGPAPKTPGMCIHLGDEVRREQCPTCRGHVEVKVMSCAIHGECTTGKKVGGLAFCQGCLDRVDATGPPRLLRNQVIGFPGLRPFHRLNCSLAWWRGEPWLAWRNGWNRAKVGLGKLDLETAQVHGGIVLDGAGGPERLAQEDPRLFVFRDELHVAYTGVVWWGRVGDMASTRTNCCYGRVSGGDLVDNHCPDLQGRQYWEKNWGYFDHEGSLYAVHTISPHRVAAVSGDEAHFAHEVPFLPAWHPWLLRGGATPVRVGGEYYSFFHGWQKPAHRRIYCMGLYTFEAHPPFRPLRVAREPLLMPDFADRGLNPGRDPDIVYPGGAVLLGGRWLVAGGYYDVQCRLWEFSAEEVERCLVKA